MHRIGGNITPQTAFTYEGWSTGAKQEKGMWFQVELPYLINLSEINFNSPSSIKRGWRPDPKNPGPPPTISTYPKIFTIETSIDGVNWAEKSQNNKGKDGENIILINNIKTKFLRIKLTEPLIGNGDDLPWSMRTLKIFGTSSEKGML